VGTVCDSRAFSAGRSSWQFLTWIVAVVSSMVLFELLWVSRLLQAAQMGQS
jgi:hypothetical protein